MSVLGAVLTAFGVVAQAASVAGTANKSPSALVALPRVLGLTTTTMAVIVISRRALRSEDDVDAPKQIRRALYLSVATLVALGIVWAIAMAASVGE